MKLYAMYAIGLALTVVCGAGTAAAQTTASDQKYIEVTGGPTFGHKAGGSIGAEGAWYFMPAIGVFVEGGYMSNVTSARTDSDAQAIASFVGLSATPKSKAGYFDAGVTYRIPMQGRLKPYALLGFGIATVSTTTQWTSGGSDVSGQLANFGVSPGTDLGGSYTRPFVTAGFGVHYPFGSRWLADVSYRYGWIGKNSADDNNIASINTNRLQFGVGARF